MSSLWIMQEGESHHLFVHCGRVYMLWTRVAKMWDLNFMGASNVSVKFVMRDLTWIDHRRECTIICDKLYRNHVKLLSNI